MMCTYIRSVFNAVTVAGDVLAVEEVGPPELSNTSSRNSAPSGGMDKLLDRWLVMGNRVSFLRYSYVDILKTRIQQGWTYFCRH